MNLEYELNKAWSKTLNTNAIKERINLTIKKHTPYDLSYIEFDILCFVSVAPTTQAKIMRSEYFSDISLSTIKRAVAFLLTCELIVAIKSKDGREKLLALRKNEVNQYLYEESETQEVCPMCGVEVTIKTDGKSDCPECGQKEVLPCSMCRLADEFKCDWNTETRCTAFPKEADNV